MNIEWKQIGEQLLTHVYLSFIAVFIAILIGIALAILVYKWKKLSTFVINFSGMIQTIPSLAIFGILIPFIYDIDLIVIITLILYAIFPITSNTIIALQKTNQDFIDVGKSLGMTRFKILFFIKIRIGLSTIIGGIRIASILIIGTTTIAVFIGAGGLGELIMTGINRREIYLVLQGTIPVAIIAIFVSVSLLLVEKAFVVKELK